MGLIQKSQSDQSCGMTTIKVTGFSSLSLAEKKDCITSISQSVVSPTEKELQQQREYLQAKISSFETKYRMPSDTMRKLLLSGEIPETADLCSWSMLLKIRDDFESQHAKC